VLPARFRKQITIEAKTVTRGPLGDDVSWTNVATVTGAVYPLGARERAQFQQMQHSVSHRLLFDRSLIASADWDAVKAIAPDSHRLVSGSRYFLPVEPALNYGEVDRYVGVVCREG